MGSSHSHDHRDDVITYPEWIGFAEKHQFPEKQVIIKRILAWKQSVSLNLEKKEKIGDHGVTLSNSQEILKFFSKTSILPSTELLSLPPN